MNLGKKLKKLNQKTKIGSKSSSEYQPRLGNCLWS